MKYRSHRELLSESMDTVVEVNSIEKLREHIQSNWSKSIFDIKITPYGGIDKRINWNTHVVQINFKQDGDFAVAGFTNQLDFN